MLITVLGGGKRLWRRKAADWVTGTLARGEQIPLGELEEWIKSTGCGARSPGWRRVSWVGLPMPLYAGPEFCYIGGISLLRPRTHWSRWAATGLPSRCSAASDYHRHHRPPHKMHTDSHQCWRSHKPFRLGFDWKLAFSLGMFAHARHPRQIIGKSPSKWMTQSQQYFSLVVSMNSKIM